MAKAEAISAPPSEHHVEDYEPKSEDLDAEHEIDDLEDAKPKKKRKVIKATDKKYECPQEGCGKSYSRAEHLYRHQLNRRSYLPSQARSLRLHALHLHMVRNNTG